MNIYETKDRTTMKNVKEPHFKDNILKRGNRIIGYIVETKTEGWGYIFGKPSDQNSLRFTGNDPLTEDQAKERLLKYSN